MSNNQMPMQATPKAQPQAQKPKFSVLIGTQNYQRMINNTLRDPERAKRFVAAITSAVATNPALQECVPATVLSGALLGEGMNLSPSPQLGQYYLVPFERKIKGPDGKTVWLFDERGNHLKDNNGKWMAMSEKIAQFQIGYKGYIQLAMRSGQYLDIDSIEIREGEYKGRDKRTGKQVFEFIEDDDLREDLPVIGYLAYFELLNGFRKSVYFSKTKMLKHADTYSQAFSAEKYQQLLNGEIPEKELWKYSSFWYKNFDAMAQKTVLRQLLSKYGVLSIEMQTALEKDMAAINEDGTADYIDSPDYSTSDVPQPPASEPPVVDAEVVGDTMEDAEEVDLNDV